MVRKDKGVNVIVILLFTTLFITMLCCGYKVWYSNKFQSIFLMWTSLGNLIFIFREFNSKSNRYVENISLVYIFVLIMLLTSNIVKFSINV